MLIVATAAIGLALVGVMAMRMTPGRTTSRDALITVSTSAVFQTVSADSFGELAGAASNGGRRFTDLLGRTLSSFFASSDRSQVSASTIALPTGATSGVGGTAFAVVTPIGTEGLGVTTAAAVEGQSGKIDAMLPSGAIITAELIATHDGIAVVELPEADLVAATRLAAADHPDDLTVIAFGDEFSVHGDGAELQSLAVPEAAPIFAADGTLVGLCTVGPDGVEMLSVGSLSDLAGPPATDTTDSTESSEPTETTETTESTESTESTKDVASTEAIDDVSAATSDPANRPTTATETPSASTGATSAESVVPTSDLPDDSNPATTVDR